MGRFLSVVAFVALSAIACSPAQGAPADAGQCTYTLSGAHTSAGTCNVETVAYTGGKLGLALLGTDGASSAPGTGTWTFNTVLSTTQTQLSTGTFDGSSSVASQATYTIGSALDIWDECLDPTNINGTAGNPDCTVNMMPAQQGAFTLTITSVGPSEGSGSMTIWPAAHGTLSITLPADPDPTSHATGTVTISAGF